MGLGEGVAFPAIHSIIARCVPQERQSTAVGVVTAASYVGTALAFGLAPTIIEELGWPVSMSHQKGEWGISLPVRCWRPELGGLSGALLLLACSCSSLPALPALPPAVGVLSVWCLCCALAAPLAAPTDRRRQSAQRRQQRQGIQCP